jgi:hypothetical protein
VLDVSAEQSRSLEVLSALANEQASLQRALLDALIRLCNQVETHNHHLEELIVVMTSGRDEGGVEDEGIPTHDLSGDPIRVR